MNRRYTFESMIASSTDPEKRIVVYFWDTRNSGGRPLPLVAEINRVDEDALIKLFPSGLSVETLGTIFEQIYFAIAISVHENTMERQNTMEHQK